MTAADGDAVAPVASALAESTLAPASRATLVALVVTYNRMDQICETVGRLQAESCDKIYVVDNGSTDGTREWLREQATDPRLKVVLSETNGGGAGGFELGLRLIVENEDPDWIVLMDDDGRPEPGCLARFLETDVSAYDAVSAAVFLQNGDICEMNRPTRNPFWSFGTFARTALGAILGNSRHGFHIPDEAYIPTASPTPIDATSFVGLFLPRKTIQQIGFPDGRMFIYGDDVQYTLRLRKAGMTIGFLPSLRFEHDYNRVYSGKRGRFSPIWKAYYTARNGIVVYRYAAGPLFWLAILIILPKWAVAGLSYGDTRKTYYRLMWAGIRDGFSGGHIRPHAEVMSLAAT